MAKYTQNKSTFSVLKSLFQNLQVLHTLSLYMYPYNKTHSPCFQSCFVSDSFIAFVSEMFKSNHCLWVLGLYFDRSVGLYFDGVGVLVLLSMQNQVIWGLIVEFLCRLLWWVWSLIRLNIGCWFEVEDKKDGFIYYFMGFWLRCTPKQDWDFVFDTARLSLLCIFNYGRKKKTKDECE